MGRTNYTVEEIIVKLRNTSDMNGWNAYEIVRLRHTLSLAVKDDAFG